MSPLIFSLLALTAAAAFTPCPLLGPRFPKPTDIAQSSVVKEALRNLTLTLDQGVATSNTFNGPITPNSTSFSVVLFDGTPVQNGQSPFFYQYHHTAPASARPNAVNADSIYRIGGLTEVFNVWAFLAAAGSEHWQDPVTRWVPELAAAAQQHSAAQSPIDFVDWESIILADIASNVAGLERNCGSSRSIIGADFEKVRNCSFTRTDFLDTITTQPPVFPPGSTPFKSIAGFQILSYALEAISGKPFSTILQDRILTPLNMTQTSLTLPDDPTNAIIPADRSSLWSLDLGDQSAASGLYTSPHDLASAGKSIIASSLVPSTTTERWLKPVTHTSNVVNAVGAPWEIYTAARNITDTVVDVYTSRGNFGLYSSYFGVVPDYDIGFAILAADESANADLNAYADLVSDILPAWEVVAQMQAERNFAGSYVSGSGSMVNMSSEGAKMPGLSVDEIMVDGKDMRAEYAEALGIGPRALSMRLYPTELSGGGRVAFKAIFQNMDELIDAGTPTCETWRDANKLFNGTTPSDMFVFEVGEDGKATGLEVPALGAEVFARRN